MAIAPLLPRIGGVGEFELLKSQLLMTTATGINRFQESGRASRHCLLATSLFLMKPWTLGEWALFMAKICVFCFFVIAKDSISSLLVWEKLLFRQKNEGAITVLDLLGTLIAGTFFETTTSFQRIFEELTFGNDESPVLSSSLRRPWRYIGSRRE